jgi:endonuclease YncB( thermonuclease family)
VTQHGEHVERALGNRARGAYWRWRATILRVLDGDTVEVELDLGLGITVTPVPNVSLCHVRFLGYDAPELATDDGQRARAALGAILPPLQLEPVFVNSAALDEYGRILGTIDLPDGRSVIDEMVKLGWLRPYNGRGVKPWARRRT